MLYHECKKDIFHLAFYEGVVLLMKGCISNRVVLPYKNCVILLAFFVLNVANVIVIALVGD